MKIGLLIKNEGELAYETFLYGIAITWWKREYAPKWHVGFRITICMGSHKYGVRFSTYQFPRLSYPGSQLVVKRTLKPCKFEAI